jgi:hypothetical protein
MTAQPALAMSHHGGKAHASKTGMDMGAMGYKHETVVDGVHSEFQIMSLASMNMKDDQGRTHHVMVKLIDAQSKTEIKDAVGKIKIIEPGGGEQEGTLKNYSGILAANFNFKTAGKYGVICLYKAKDGRKRVVKFWYHHKQG